MGIVENIYLLIFYLLRISGMLVVAPMYSSSNIPNQIKVVIALVLSLFVTMINPVDITLSLTAELIPLVLNEIIIGLLLGFIAQIIFSSAAVAGALIDNQAGLMMSATYDPISNTNQSFYGRLYNVVLLVVFVSLDGPYFLLNALVSSYEMIPSFNLSQTSMIIYYLIQTVSRGFFVGVQLSLPIVIVVYLSNFSLGILSRTIPQINMFVIGVPVKILISFLVSLVMINPIFNFFVRIVEVILEVLNGFLNIL